MANLNIDSAKERTFDAIVIGSGMSGGWAAKELTGKGLKTLMLERGRDVKHLKDYPTTNLYPWEFEHRGEVPMDIQEANPVVPVLCLQRRRHALFCKGSSASLRANKAL